MSRKSKRQTKVQMHTLETGLDLQRRRTDKLICLLGDYIIKTGRRMDKLAEEICMMKAEFDLMKGDFYHPQRAQDSLADGMAAHEALRRVRRMEREQERLEHTVNTMGWIILLAHICIVLLSLALIWRW